jgi:hypothetical protein
MVADMMHVSCVAICRGKVRGVVARRCERSVGQLAHGVSLIHTHISMCHVRPSPGAGRADTVIRACCRRRDWKTEHSDDEVMHLELA